LSSLLLVSVVWFLAAGGFRSLPAVHVLVVQSFSHGHRGVKKQYNEGKKIAAESRNTGISS
jgi:hypothetical protein